MGSAAYNRGNKVISRQFDDEAQAKRCIRVDKYDLAAIEEQRDRLASELVQLKLDNERLVLRWRERCATLTAERINATQREAALLARAHSAEAAMMLYRRRWHWVSCLVRSVVSPQQVQAYRDEVADLGNLGKDCPR